MHQAPNQHFLSRQFQAGHYLFGVFHWSFDQPVKPEDEITGAFARFTFWSATDSVSSIGVTMGRKKQV